MARYRNDPIDGPCWVLQVALAFNENGWADEHFGACADNALMLCRLHGYSPSTKMGFVGSWEGDPAFSLPVTDTNIIRSRVSCHEPMQYCPGVSKRRRSSIEMPPVEKTPPEMEAAFKGQVLSGVQGSLNVV